MNETEARVLVNRLTASAFREAGHASWKAERLEAEAKLVAALAAKPEQPKTKVLTVREFKDEQLRYWQAARDNVAYQGYMRMLQSHERLRVLVGSLWITTDQSAVDEDARSEIREIIRGGQ